MLTISSVKVLSPVVGTAWVQVFEYLPEDPTIRATRGKLFLLVASDYLRSSIDSLTLAREFASRFVNEYYAKGDSTPFYALKTSGEKVLREYLSLWGKAEFAAISYVADALYSSAGGGAGVMIMRGGMLAEILVSVRGEDAIAASGYPQAGDVVIISTKSFSDGVAVGNLKNLISAGIATVSSQLQPLLNSPEISGTAGGLFLSFSKTNNFSISNKFSGISRKIPKLNFRLIAEKIKSFPGVILKKTQKPEGFTSRREIYLKGDLDTTEEGKKNSVMVTVGVALLIMLAASIIWGIWQKKVSKAKKQLQESVASAEHLISEAEGLKGIDNIRARDLIGEGGKVITELTKNKSESTEIDDLVKKLKNARETVLGDYQITPDLFLDLSLQTSGFSGSRIVISEENIYVLDTQAGRVIATTADSKKTSVVANPDQVKGAEEIAAYGDRVFVLESDGIYEVGNTKKKVIGKDWKGDGLFLAYSGNIYLVDKGGSAIWRFVGDGLNFGTKQKWLATGVTPDLSKATSLAIDGSIWIINESGRVQRFSLGNPQSFTISGVEGSSNFRAIYTNETLKDLYLLDKDGGRVVVVDKDGNYLAQYVSNQIKEATGLVVSADKIILLSGAKLWSIPLKHLQN